MSKQFVMLAAALSVAAFGQAPTKVGFINMQSAIIGTKDGQKAAQELEARRAPRAKEFEKRQADIRQLQDSLNRGGNAMAEAAKQNLVRDIDAKTKVFNRDLEDAQAEWEQDQRKVIDEIGQKLMVVITKYATDNGYAFVVDVSNPQSPVLFASSANEVTKEIIDLYDKNSAGIAAPAAKPSATPAKPPAAAKPVAPPPAPAKK